MDNSAYFSMSNARTAGNNAQQYKTIQAWKTKNTAPIKPTDPAQQQILANLENAAQGKVGAFNIDLKTNMAYADSSQQIESPTKQKADTYQFKDVIDIVNPLQHLPIVNMAYRGLTNDKIHPFSQIIGGAIYGGPVGAVTGTINAISQIQTGKDLGDHALSLVGIGNKINNQTPNKNNPEQRLSDVASAIENKSPLEKLPGTTMAFVNLSEPQKAYHYTKIAEGRTAGSMIAKNYNVSYQQRSEGTVNYSNASAELNLNKLPVKEEITSISLSAMPPRRVI